MKKRYERLLREGRIHRHRPQREEIVDLLAVIERDLRDAALSNLSPDRRFAIAYNAMLQMARAVMFSEGYRTRGTGHHATTLDFLAEALGSQYAELVDYFDDCRRKRNLADYVGVGYASQTEADELLTEAKRFAQITGDWIRRHHPDLMT
jgi:uncharacterized protein (UPF0332 family)